MREVSQHKATIGRKVWYWHPQVSAVEDTLQAFDATVIYVYPDGDVKLQATNHWGTTNTVSRVKLYDPSTDDRHGAVDYAYCTWMPYQKQQMDSQKQGDQK